MNGSLPGSSVHRILQARTHWSGLPFPSAGDLPNAGIKTTCPVLAGGFFFLLLSHLGSSPTPDHSQSALLPFPSFLLASSLLLFKDAIFIESFPQAHFPLPSELKAGSGSLQQHLTPPF